MKLVGTTRAGPGNESPRAGVVDQTLSTPELVAERGPPTQHPRKLTSGADADRKPSRDGHSASESNLVSKNRNRRWDLVHAIGISRIDGVRWHIPKPTYQQPILSAVWSFRMLRLLCVIYYYPSYVKRVSQR